MYGSFVAFTTFIRNGEILPLEQATVSLSSIEYAYGFGVYESIRVVRGKALFLSEHIERLMHSATVIGLDHAFTPAMIAEWTQKLIDECPCDAMNLKMLLIGAREPKHATLSILPLMPLFPDKKLYVKGAMAISAEYERQFPDAKTLNMLGSYLAYRRAKAAGGYDAVLINKAGYITEGTRTNFFVIKGKTITGAPRKEILEGVTMKHVLDVARANGFEVREGDIALGDLKNYDGAFLTSTSSKIMPLSTIDDTEIGVPETLKELMRHFNDFLATHGC